MGKCKLYIDPLFIQGAIRNLNNASVGKIFKALVYKEETGLDPFWLSERERQTFEKLWDNHERTKMLLRGGIKG
nr:MAG TPA: hypothetical protein [Caudoviricetes sp.]